MVSKKPIPPANNKKPVPPAKPAAKTPPAAPAKTPPKTAAVSAKPAVAPAPKPKLAAVPAPAASPELQKTEDEILTEMIAKEEADKAAAAGEQPPATDGGDKSADGAAAPKTAGKPQKPVIMRMGSGLTRSRKQIQSAANRLVAWAPKLAERKGEHDDNIIDAGNRLTTLLAEYNAIVGLLLPAAQSKWTPPAGVGSGTPAVTRDFQEGDILVLRERTATVRARYSDILDDEPNEDLTFIKLGGDKKRAVLKTDSGQKMVIPLRDLKKKADVDDVFGEDDEAEAGEEAEEGDAAEGDGGDEAPVEEQGEPEA